MYTHIPIMCFLPTKYSHYYLIFLLVTNNKKSSSFNVLSISFTTLQVCTYSATIALIISYYIYKNYT